MREICLDIETTGLDPKDGHRIIEIACIELINKIKTGKVFHTYVNPRREVPQEAFRIHGISTEFLQDKPIFDHIAQDFLNFVDGAKIVIHNAAFDTKFLNYELASLNLKKLNPENIIDSLLLARKKFAGAQNSLDALCRRFGIDLSRRKHHGALLDTELLCDVYIELMGGTQSTFGFDSNIQSSKKLNNEEATTSSDDKTWPNPWSSNLNLKIDSKINSEVEFQNNDQNYTKKETLAKRNFTASQDEIELHKKFILENFKSNLWEY